MNTFFENTNDNSMIPVQSNSRSCPHCGSSYLDRVQRRVIDKVVALAVPLKRYRCESCGWQGNLKSTRD